MKVLVTGVKGQLGYDVVKELTARGIECRGADIDDFDLTDEAAVMAYVTDYAPAAIIHCAAYTAVDKAEEMRDACYNVNVLGSRYIARAAKAVDAKLLQVSTDYVYAGGGEAPHLVTEKKAPKSWYGETKAMGEDEAAAATKKLFIVRIAWAFGLNGNNFVKTMLRLGAERPEINVVCDQIGSPTYTHDLAVLLCDMIATEKYGIYHATNEGFCSWYEFTKEIMRQANLPAKVNPIPSSEYKTAAARPLNSRLDKTCLDDGDFNRLPMWQDALARYLRELKENQ